MIIDVDESDDDYSSLSGEEIESDDEEGYSDDEDNSTQSECGSINESTVTEQREDIRWDVGQVIRVRFTGGHSRIHRKVIKYAKIWMKYANITFRFVSSDPSDVRISFFKGEGCHSATGRNALKIQAPKPTMNLGFSIHSPEEKIRRHVLHEFGHVLGCAHEHSSPNARIPWNERAVYAYFRKEEGWDQREVYRNVLTVKRSTSIASEFDPKSIMLYEIPREITRGGFYTHNNTKLSDIDKYFIAKQYPKPLKCNRCRHTIRESEDIHFYCKSHKNYLCEDCYDSSSTRQQVRREECSYRAENDEDGEFLKCNRCRAGTRRSRDDFYYCAYHDNHLCGRCYDTRSTRRQVRRGECLYEDEYTNEYDSDDEYDGWR